MNFLSALINGENTVKAISDTVDTLFTSEEERLEKHNELLKANRDFDSLQNKIVTEKTTTVHEGENANRSLFMAGWRPAIGWIGVLALFYQFIVYPLLCWIPDLNAAPVFNNDALYPLIVGMLGMGILRSFDKMKGTDTKYFT